MKHDFSLQFERSCEALKILQSETDAQGRRLEVTKLHLPDPLFRTAEELPVCEVWTVAWPGYLFKLHSLLCRCSALCDRASFVIYMTGINGNALRASSGVLTAVKVLIASSLCGQVCASHSEIL